MRLFNRRLIVIGLVIIAFFILFDLFFNKMSFSCNAQKSTIQNFSVDDSDNDLAVIDAGNASSIHQLFTLTSDYPVITDVAFSPDSSLLAASNGKVVTVWNLTSREKIATLVGHKEQILAIAFDPKGTILASGSRDNTVHIWDTRTFIEVYVISDISGEVEDVVFTPDGKELIIANEGIDSLSNLNTKEYKRVSQFPQEVVFAKSISVNNEGACILAAVRPAYSTGGSSLLLIKVNGLNDFLTIVSYESDVTSVAFSPEGSHMAAGLLDNTARIWSISHLEEYAILRHSSDVNDLEFGLRGDLLASSSGDLGSNKGSMILWNLDTKDVVFQENTHTNIVSAVAFSLDGRLLASADYGGVIQVWGIEN